MLRVLRVWQWSCQLGSGVCWCSDPVLKPAKLLAENDCGSAVEAAYGFTLSTCECSLASSCHKRAQAAQQPMSLLTCLLCLFTADTGHEYCSHSGRRSPL